MLRWLPAPDENTSHLIVDNVVDLPVGAITLITEYDSATDLILGKWYGRSIHGFREQHSEKGKPIEILGPFDTEAEASAAVEEQYRQGEMVRLESTNRVDCRGTVGRLTSKAPNVT